MSEDKFPFMRHLEELRKRLIACVVALVVGFVLCFNFSDLLFEWLTMPMHKTIHMQMTEPYMSFVNSPSPGELVALAPAEAFWVDMKISIIAGVVVTIPFIFWQLWRFISPGLRPREKRLAIPFVAITSTLFILGAAFCFFIVLPFAMSFLLGYKAQFVRPMLSVEKYMDFCLKFILAFGAVFELPVVIVFLTRLGIVTPDMLAKHRKYAVLVAFIIAAILTPTPDAFNQTLMAVPIIFLYEAGILASRILPSRKAEAAAQAKTDK